MEPFAGMTQDSFGGVTVEIDAAGPSQLTIASCYVN
jgi:hypothetical protein